MNEKDRQAVDAAKATRQPDTRTPRQSKQGTGRTTESAQIAGNALQIKIAEGRKQLKDNMKKQIVLGAVADLITDFENEDYGDLSCLDDLFIGLNAPLETEYRVLEAWEDKGQTPNLSLPSAAVLNG